MSCEMPTPKIVYVKTNSKKSKEVSKEREIAELKAEIKRLERELELERHANFQASILR